MSCTSTLWVSGHNSILPLVWILTTQTLQASLLQTVPACRDRPSAAGDLRPLGHPGDVRVCVYLLRGVYNDHSLQTRVRMKDNKPHNGACDASPVDTRGKRAAHDQKQKKKKKKTHRGIGRKWGMEEYTWDNKEDTCILLTSRNLSHLPVSHLSSRKLPLSERAETYPKAHTQSRVMLSICGNKHGAAARTQTQTWTDRERGQGSGLLGQKSITTARQRWEQSTGSGALRMRRGFCPLLPCRISCSLQTVCARCRFLSLYQQPSSSSPLPPSLHRSVRSSKPGTRTALCAPLRRERVRLENNI